MWVGSGHKLMCVVTLVGCFDWKYKNGPRIGNAVPWPVNKKLVHRPRILQWAIVLRMS
jgi:hypothetical protein